MARNNSERGGNKGHMMTQSATFLAKHPEDDASPAVRSRATVIESRRDATFGGGKDLLIAFGGKAVPFGPSRTSSTRCYAPRRWMEELYSSERDIISQRIAAAQEKGRVVKRADGKPLTIPCEVQALKEGQLSSWFVQRLHASDLSGVVILKKAARSPAGWTAEAEVSDECVSFTVYSESCYGEVAHNYGGKRAPAQSDSEGEFIDLDSALSDYDIQE